MYKNQLHHQPQQRIICFGIHRMSQNLSYLLSVINDLTNRVRCFFTEFIRYCIDIVLHESRELSESSTSNTSIFFHCKISIVGTFTWILEKTFIFIFILDQYRFASETFSFRSNRKCWFLSLFFSFLLRLMQYIIKRKYDSSLRCPTYIYTYSYKRTKRSKGSSYTAVQSFLKLSYCRSRSNNQIDFLYVR